MAKPAIDIKEEIYQKAMANHFAEESFRNAVARSPSHSNTACAQAWREKRAAYYALQEACARNACQMPGNNHGLRRQLIPDETVGDMALQTGVSHDSGHD